MTSAPQPLSVAEVLVAAQSSRPGFTLDQISDVLWRLLWAGELDGVVQIAPEQILSTWVKPASPAALRIRLPAKPVIGVLTEADSIADFVLSLLAFSGTGPPASGVDGVLFAALMQAKVSVTETSSSEARRRFASVSYAEAAEAAVVRLLFEQIAFDYRVTNIVQRVISPSPSSAADAEAGCQRWLEQRMRSERDAPLKAEVQKDALERFTGLTAHGFRRAWRQAVEAVPETTWGKRGPKAGRRRAKPVG